MAWACDLQGSKSGPGSFNADVEFGCILHTALPRTRNLLTQVDWMWGGWAEEKNYWAHATNGKLKRAKTTRPPRPFNLATALQGHLQRLSEVKQVEPRQNCAFTTPRKHAGPHLQTAFQPQPALPTGQFPTYLEAKQLWTVQGFVASLPEVLVDMTFCLSHFSSTFSSPRSLHLLSGHQHRKAV